MTLPNTHWALGQHVQTAGAFRDELADLYREHEQVAAELAAAHAASAARTMASGISGKVKTAAEMAREMTHTQAIEGRLRQVLSRLGEAAYDRHGYAAGPAEVVGPVKQARAELTALDSETARLSEAAGIGKQQVRPTIAGIAGVGWSDLLRRQSAMMGAGVVVLERFQSQLT